MDHNKKGNKQDFKSHLEKFLQAIKQAKKYLILGKPNICAEKAFKAVQEAKDQLGGENSIQLMPGLITVAEGHIEESMQISESIISLQQKLNSQELAEYEIQEIEEKIRQEMHIKEEKLKKAEKSLIACQWNFIKSQPDKEEDDSGDKKNQQNLSFEEIQQHKCNLSKVFCKLYMTQENYKMAQQELRNSIFMDSQKYGANHIITALDYYQMGQVLMKKQNIQQAEQFYGKTAEIFYKFFKYYFRLQEQMQLENQQFYNSLNDVDSIVHLEVINCCEKILQYFNNYQEKDRRYVMKPILDSLRALSLLHQFEPFDSQERQQDLNTSDMDNSFGEMTLSYRQKKYEDYIKEAGFECMNWKGDEHPKTIRLKQIMQSFGEHYENQEYQDEGQYDEQQQY